MQIIQYILKNPNIPYYKTKRVKQSTKINTRSQKALIYYIKQNSNNKLAILSTPFKSSYTLSQATV